MWKSLKIHNEKNVQRTTHILVAKRNFKHEDTQELNFYQ